MYLKASRRGGAANPETKRFAPLECTTASANLESLLVTSFYERDLRMSVLWEIARAAIQGVDRPAKVGFPLLSEVQRAPLRQCRAPAPTEIATASLTRQNFVPQCCDVVHPNSCDVMTMHHQASVSCESDWNKITPAGNTSLTHDARISTSASILGQCWTHVRNSMIVRCLPQSAPRSSIRFTSQIDERSSRDALSVVPMMKVVRCRMSLPCQHCASHVVRIDCQLTLDQSSTIHPVSMAPAGCERMN